MSTESNKELKAKTNSEEKKESEGSSPKESFRIDFDYGEYYGYLAYYSAEAHIYEAPIGNIRIENNTREDIDTLITVSAKPAFFTPVTFGADEIKGESFCQIRCPKLRVNPSALAFLPKDTVVKYTVTVNKKDGTLLCSKDATARLASVSSWGGVHCQPETAASIVNDNSESIKELAERARQIYGSEYGSDGYSAKTVFDIRNLFSAVYDAVKEIGITYSTGTFYPDEKGVYVSAPELTAYRKKGNSMEIALLIVSVLKALGMNTVIAFTSSNTLPGVFTEDLSFSVPVNDDLDEINRAVTEGKLIFIDPSSVIKGVSISFDTAEERGGHALEREDKYYLTLDITSCNAKGIRSLPPRIATEEGLCFSDESTGVPENFFAIGEGEEEFDLTKKKLTPTVKGKRRILNRSDRLMGRAVRRKADSHYVSDFCFEISIPASRLFEEISRKTVMLPITPLGKDSLISRKKAETIGEALSSHEILRYTWASREELVISLCTVTYKDEAKGHYYTAPLCFIPVKAKVDKESSRIFMEKASPNKMILNTVLTERLDKLFGTDLSDAVSYESRELSDAVNYLKDRTFGFSKSEIYVNEDDSFLELMDITPLTAMRSSFKDGLSDVKYSDKITAVKYNSPSGIPCEGKSEPARILMGASAYEAYKALSEKESLLVRSDSLYSKAYFAFKASKDALEKGKKTLYISGSLRSAGIFKSFFDANDGSDLYTDLSCGKINPSDLFEYDEAYLKRGDEGEIGDISAMKEKHDAYFKAVMKKYPMGLSFLSACKGYFSQIDSKYMPLYDINRIGKMTKEDVAELFVKVSDYLSTAEKLMDTSKDEKERVNIFETPLDKVYMTSSSTEENHRLYVDSSELCEKLLSELALLKGSYEALTEYVFGESYPPEYGKIPVLCDFAQLLLSSEKAGKYVKENADISVYSDARIALSLLEEARELKKGREIFGEELLSLPKLPPDPITFRDSYEQTMKKGFFAKKEAKSTLLKQFENLLSDPSLVDAGKAEIYTNRLAEAYELESKADISAARAIFGDNEDSTVMEETVQMLFKLSVEAEKVSSMFSDKISVTPSDFMGKNVKRSLELLSEEGKYGEKNIWELIKNLRSSKENVSSLTRQLSEMLFMKDVPSFERGCSYEETEAFFTKLYKELPKLPLWCEWRLAGVTAKEYGFESMTELFRNNILTADEARDAFVKGFYRTVCDYIIESTPALKDFSAEEYENNTQRLIKDCVRYETAKDKSIDLSDFNKVVIASVTDIPCEYFGSKYFDLVIFDDGEITPASLLSPVMSLGEACLILSLEKEKDKDKKLPYNAAYTVMGKRETMSVSSCASRVFDVYYRADSSPLSPYRTLTSLQEHESRFFTASSINLIKANGMCLSSPESIHSDITERRADDVIRASYVNSAEAQSAVKASIMLLSRDDISSCVIYTLTESQKKLIEEKLKKQNLIDKEKVIIVSSLEERRVIPADCVIISTVLSMPDSSSFPAVLPFAGGVFVSDRSDMLLEEIALSARDSLTVITSLEEKNLSSSVMLLDPYAPLKRFLKRIFFSQKAKISKGEEKPPLSAAARYFISRSDKNISETDLVFDENAILKGEITLTPNRVYTINIYKSSL